MSLKEINIAIASVFLMGLIAYALTGGFEDSLEEKAIGEWAVIPEMDGCDPDLRIGIRMNENGTIEGLLGFVNYRIEETNQDNSHLIVDGGYEDSRHYNIQIDDEEILTLRNENSPEKFTCKLQKVDSLVAILNE